MTDSNIIIALLSVYSAGFTIESFRSYKDWKNPNSQREALIAVGMDPDSLTPEGKAGLKFGMWMAILGIPLFWPAQKLFKLFWWGVLGREEAPEGLPPLEDMPPMEPLDDTPPPVPPLLRGPLEMAKEVLDEGVVTNGKFIDLDSMYVTVQLTLYFNDMPITFTTHDAGQSMSATMRMKDGTTHHVRFKTEYNEGTDKPILVWEHTPENVHLHKAIDTLVFLAHRTFQKIKGAAGVV